MIDQRCYFMYNKDGTFRAEEVVLKQSEIAADDTESGELDRASIQRDEHLVKYNPTASPTFKGVLERIHRALKELTPASMQDDRRLRPSATSREPHPRSGLHTPID
jgi:hypothetical protein